MLQQTQVDRVLPKYLAFMERFPDVGSLARAPLSDVLILWQGLGYNRRAKMLHDAVKVVVNEHGGTIPREYNALRALPGVGDYTARAVRTFVFDEREVFIETNIRAVYIHHFFSDSAPVQDADILPLILRTLPRGKYALWYAALMDYGSYIKRTTSNPSRKSATYTKQTPFKGSRREIRGAIIRRLASGRVSKKRLYAEPFNMESIEEEIRSLEREGMVACTNVSCALAR